MITILVYTALCCAALPAILFCWNLMIYRSPCAVTSPDAQPISVLIPARNEEQSIAAAVRSVLASQGIELELIVLDDASTDGTAAIVQSFQDPRVRLESAPPLPAGWNGKQHACYVLASHARYDLFCFIDADVRVQPDALARMSAFLSSSRSSLVSGFPYQETGSFLEWLLLPLIHFILLGYLPLAGMRRFPSPGFAAGCGQFLMLRRDAYVASGGHQSIRTTMHDGLLLPQLLRRHGFRTDIADLTSLATCRMYRNANEVWKGLAKNATEGLAAPSRIVPFTLLLFCGQVLPCILAGYLLLQENSLLRPLLGLSLAALALCCLPRMLASVRFRQTPLSAILHPLGVLVLLVLQWYALVCKLRGRQATWKQRAYNPG